MPGGLSVGNSVRLGTRVGASIDLEDTEVSDSVSVPHTAIVYGDDMYYLHTQTVAAATWTITHNLGQRPNVAVLDEDGNEVFADVDHASINQVVITFPTPFAGSAILS